VARKAKSRQTARPPSGVTNDRLAEMLREMALRLEMAGVPFKPRAYEKAAHAVEAVVQPLGELYRGAGLKALEQLPGIGKGIAGRIEEALRSGSIADLEKLREQVPVDVLGLKRVEGLGPKIARALYEELGIRDLDGLEAAARAGRIRELPHFGEKTEQKLLRGIEFLRQASGRIPLGAALRSAQPIEEHLRGAPGVGEVRIAGSIRRRKETIGDIDVLAVSDCPEDVMERFAGMPSVAHVYARGPSKTLVRLESGIDADLRVVPAESFGAALLYFTGSKAHNVALRTFAQARRLKLNEYGLFKGSKRLPARTEEELYEALGLPFIPPELREDQGEIEAAREGRLPELVGYDELRGDLQTQTDWTDGADSIERMAEAARELGLEYIAVTDHTRDLPMTGGADEKKLLEQARAIGKLNRRLRGIRVLTGAELNIRRDGTLDIADEVLARLDVVGAAIHSHFGLPREEMTRRVVRAMENPHVDVLFHPTARSLGKRPAVELDFEAVLEAARRTGTALEIDGQPDRLDLDDEHVRKAVEAGVKLVVDSDAHSAAELRYARDFGVAVARRGWAQRSDVLNTLRLEDFLASLKNGRQGL
jgi:DNA polymerase (family X)